MFPSRAAWEEERAAILKAATDFQALRGQLSREPAALARVMSSLEALAARAQRLYVYAGFSFNVDTTDPAAAAMNDKALAVLGTVNAAVSFVNPELIAVGQETLSRWMTEDPRLSVYSHYVHDLFRRQAHVRSSEVEELLGALSDPFSTPSNTASVLVNADFRFPDGRTTAGGRVSVTQGLVDKHLESPDRAVRRSVWESYMGTHREFRNTLASNLAGSIKNNLFRTRSRRYDSTLEAALFSQEIPQEVFHNVISVFRENLPIWHRYFRLRRKVLKLSTLRHYDMWAPLSKRKVRMSFEKAVDLICRSLAPMGEEYVEVLRRGCLEDRWVDTEPRKGKRVGAFSWGSQGTLPFILMSFTGDVSSLSTLAHELGHSMHSWFSWKTQPFVYSEYSIFAAEVASNFHQNMVRAHLLGGEGERALQVPVLEEAMANYFRYFFIMPTLARFEWETHRTVEQGQALTAESMASLMADLLEEGYGGEVAVDRERDGMIWASFPHLFEDYYVYQYATGISGANALATRVLRGDLHAVERYLSFLKAGSSLYPLDALKAAGVDLTSPVPIREAFAAMNGSIARLEELVG